MKQGVSYYHVNNFPTSNLKKNRYFFFSLKIIKKKFKIGSFYLFESILEEGKKKCLNACNDYN